MAVVAVATALQLDDRGAGDEGPGRDRGDATLQQQPAHPQRPAPGGEFAEPFGRPAALIGASSEPEQQLRRREGGGGGTQRRARAVEQPAHRPVAETEVAGDLLVAVAADGGAHDHLALQRRQRGDLGERFAYDEPALDVPLTTLDAQRGIGDPLAVVGGIADGVDRSVVHDAVQPRFDVAHLGPVAQGDPGLQQRLLEYVLGAGLRQRQPAAVAR